MTLAAQKGDLTPISTSYDFGGESVGPESWFPTETPIPEILNFQKAFEFLQGDGIQGLVGFGLEVGGVSGWKLGHWWFCHWSPFDSTHDFLVVLKRSLVVPRFPVFFFFFVVVVVVAVVVVVVVVVVW